MKKSKTKGVLASTVFRNLEKLHRAARRAFALHTATIEGLWHDYRTLDVFEQGFSAGIDYEKRRRWRKKKKVDRKG